MTTHKKFLNTVEDTIDDDNFIMLPVIDFVFKLLFGDTKHKERLISLLSAILRLPREDFVGIEVINTELHKLFEDDKKGILDIRAMLADGKQIDIEIQILPSVYMPERTLFYWAKMYTMQAKEGDTYDTLKKCITINIVDYEFLPVNKVHTVYHLTEDETRYRLTDVLEVHFCELEKLRTGMEISDADEPALNWMKFLAARTKGEMEMIAKDDKEIKEAYDYLQVISKDREKRMVYEARQAWLMDQRTREKVAREEGMREGMQEGAEKEKINIAKNLLSVGMAIADIAKVTGLMAEEIEKLRN